MVSPRHRLVIAAGILFIVVFSIFQIRRISIWDHSKTVQLNLPLEKAPQATTLAVSLPKTRGPTTRTLAPVAAPSPTPLEPESTPSPQSVLDDVLPVPSDYQYTPEEPEFCAERFGLKYIENLSKKSASYCDANSTADLRCFHNQITKDRIDSFCIGGPTIFDAQENLFNLDCHLREQTEEESIQNIPHPSKFTPYWYDTGPAHVLGHYVSEDGSRVAESSTDDPRKFTILIKRESNTHNLWHSLMEIFSFYMSLDVLRTTNDPATGRPFFGPEDIPNTQVIILDDQSEGPVYDLWGLSAGKPITRLGETNASTVQPDPASIILPLPGGSNPFWGGDWAPLACEHSELLETFSHRVLDFYGIEDSMPVENDNPLKVTFIDRQEKRRLLDKESRIERLRTIFPDVDIDLVDLAAFPFSEQLRIVRDTDILAGIHGAGLTHSMFLRPGSAVVEILPYDLGHMGFRNVAKLLDHHHFSAHASGPNKTQLREKRDWHDDDIFLEEDRFIELMEIAIKSMYNRGLLSEDVA